MLNIATTSTIFPRRRDLVVTDIMNDVDLCVWVADAKPGARIVYYTGHLSRDRLPHNDGYSEAVRRKIGELGNAAWMLGNETGCIWCSAASPWQAAGSTSPSAGLRRRSRSPSTASSSRSLPSEGRAARSPAHHRECEGHRSAGMTPPSSFHRPSNPRSQLTGRKALRAAQERTAR